MRQAEDVEQLVCAPDVIHSAPALGHRSQHQHVGARPPEVTCSKGIKALLWIRILITYGVSVTQLEFIGIITAHHTLITDFCGFLKTFNLIDDFLPKPIEQQPQPNLSMSSEIRR